MSWVRQPPAQPSFDCIYTLGLLDLLSAMWRKLRCRTAEELRQLANGLAGAGIRTGSDAVGCVVYLEAEKT